MENFCNNYLLIRGFIGSIDISSDLLVSFHLILEDHHFLGLLVASLVAFGLSVSLFSVIIKRCQNRIPMSIYQYILMWYKTHAEIGEAFYGSGPQLITQLVIFWRGIYQHDYETYLGSPSLALVWAWLEVFSIVMSFISLNLTSVWCNDELGPGPMVFWSAMCCCSTSIYRVFIFSIIFLIDPMLSTMVLLFLYMGIVGLHFYWGEGYASFSTAYFSLLVPVSYSQASSYKASSTSDTADVHDVGKSKFKQTYDLRRIKQVFATQMVFSLLLLIPYVLLNEVWVHGTQTSIACLPALKSRNFTYSTVMILLMIIMVNYQIYYSQARKYLNLNCMTKKSEEKQLSAQDDKISSPIASSHLGTVNPSYAGSRPDRERSTSLYEPYGTDKKIGNTASSRPCSMLYPYLSSAPATSEFGDRESYPGGRKCEDLKCETCPWIKEGPNFSNSITKKKYKLMTPATCTDKGLIYVVTCASCRKQYVGKAENSLRKVNTEHKKDIEKQGSLLGRHFGSVCGSENWSLQIIDKCPQGELARRERYWQDELTTLFPSGLNENKK